METYTQVNKMIALRIYGYTEIVLTIAHLNQNINDNKFNNLQALCQKCHLSHDKKQHQYSRKYGKKTKDDNLKLF